MKKTKLIYTIVEINLQVNQLNKISQFSNQHLNQLKEIVISSMKDSLEIIEFQDHYHPQKKKKFFLHGEWKPGDAVVRKFDDLSKNNEKLQKLL